MLSATPAGPRLIGERLIGPANAVTAIQLQFSEPLDPATATNPRAYNFGILSSSSSSGGGIFNLFSPFFARPGQVLHPHASLGSVSYDDATQTVTLTAAKPFLSTTFLRFIRVKGTGDNAVRDAQGIALVGHGHTGSDASIHLRFFRSKTVSYTDPQGSRVSLRLKGPGTLAVFLPTYGNKTPVVFLQNTTADSTTLTGTIHASKRSNGTASLQELSGVSSVTDLLGSNFVIGLTQQ